MKAEHINPFIQALVDTFHARFNVQPEHEPPFVRSGVSDQAWEVSAATGVMGKLRGTVVLHCSSSVAMKLASAASGSTVNQVDDEVAETMAALLQDILASAAGRAPELEMIPSAPAVFIGPGHRTAFGQSIPCISIPFASSLGDMALEIALAEI